MSRMDKFSAVRKRKPKIEKASGAASFWDCCKLVCANVLRDDGPTFVKSAEVSTESVEPAAMVTVSYSGVFWTSIRLLTYTSELKASVIICCCGVMLFLQLLSQNVGGRVAFHLPHVFDGLVRYAV